MLPTIATLLSFAAASECPAYDTDCDGTRFPVDCGAYENCEIARLETGQNMIFITGCRLERAQSAFLLRGVGDEKFKLWVFRRAQPADFSDIELSAGDVIAIETNGGLGKQQSVERLAEHLARQSFELISASRLRSALRQSPKSRCPASLWRVSP